MSDYFYETLVALVFYTPDRRYQKTGQVIPAGTPVHLGEYIIGNYVYPPGRVAHICGGPHAGWVRVARLGEEIQAIPGLALLARAAE